MKSKIIKLNPTDMSISFKNVSFVYNPKSPYEFAALNNISLDIEPAKITALIGSTGSGKSTLIQHINGLIIPTEGEVHINDFIIKGKQKKIPRIKHLRSEVGLVFQFPEYQLFEETIEKDIMFGPIQLGQKIKPDRVHELAKYYIEMVGLPINYLPRSPFDLSGGQKRRVAVAGILAMEGNVLILDEPTAGLDPEGEQDFIQLFNKLNKEEEKTIILVTHNMDHVLEIADNVVVMDQSEIVIQGTPNEIFSNEKLIKKLNIEPPKIYRLLYKLKEKGIELKEDIRTIPDLISSIKKYTKQKEDN